MKKLYTLRRTLSAAVLLMMSTLTWAYDFEVDGIFYEINNDETSVSVVSGGNQYSGDVFIPSSVVNGGTTYSVTGIGYRAFYVCYFLTSISIPTSVTSIESYAFSGCSSLTSISIPEGVTSIGDLAFGMCSTLTFISIPESVTSIGASAFNGCSSLVSISIPEGVTSIGVSTFANCSSLASISIPEGVMSIGSYAFSGCSSLISISLPESLTGIENSAFGGCSSLTSVICHAKNVPEFGYSDIPLENTTLYVPASALTDYKAAAQWKDFGTILPLEDIPAGISNVEVDETNAPYYTLDGKQVETPSHKGIYIKNGKKILVK